MSHEGMYKTGDSGSTRKEWLETKNGSNQSKGKKSGIQERIREDGCCAGGTYGNKKK